MAGRTRKLTENERKDRREYVKLVLVSAVFTAIGLPWWWFSGQLIGLVCAMFFGSCTLVGIIKLVNAPAHIERLLMIVACLGIAAACAGMILAGASLYPESGLAFMIVGIVGFTFFGGGGVLLTIHSVRKNSR